MSNAYKIFDQNELYYLTITVSHWIDIFTRKRYADIVLEALQFAVENKGLKVYAYVVMSNHVHLVAKAEEGYSLSDFLRDFKKYTSKKIIASLKEEPESRREWMLELFRSEENSHQFWQKDNHAFWLYSASMIKQKINYIHENPVRAGLVAEAHHYLYSSANNYGLIKLSEV